MNEIILSGNVDKYEFDHVVNDVAYYKAFISVTRSSGIVDVLPVIAREKDIKIGGVVFLGQLRSYNDNHHVRTYVLLNEYITSAEKNVCRLSGAICIKPTLRSTPQGTLISDVILAVNRAYGKTAYIPCIAWNYNAKLISEYEVGDELSIIGRFQSRTYMKNNKTISCYEVSISEVLP